METIDSTYFQKQSNGTTSNARLKRTLDPQNKLKLRQKLKMTAAFFPTDESSFQAKRPALPYKYEMLLDDWRPYSHIEEDNDSSTEYSFSHSQEQQKANPSTEIDHCLRLLFDDEIISPPLKSKGRETALNCDEKREKQAHQAIGKAEANESKEPGLSIYEKLKARNSKKQLLQTLKPKINLSATSSTFEPEGEFLGKKKQKKLSFSSSEFRDGSGQIARHGSSVNLLGTLLSNRLSYQVGSPYRVSSFSTQVLFSAT